MHWFANIQTPWNAVPAVVKVYDLQACLNLSGFSLSKRLFLTTMMRWTVARAPVLLPMSQATADSLASMLGADPARMAVVPPVLENCFRPSASGAIAEFRRRLELPEHAPADLHAYVERGCLQGRRLADRVAIVPGETS